LNKGKIVIFFSNPAHSLGKAKFIIVWWKFSTTVWWSLSPVSITSITSKTLKSLTFCSIKICYFRSIEPIERLIGFIVNKNNMWKRSRSCIIVIKRFQQSATCNWSAIWETNSFLWTFEVLSSIELS